MDTNAFDYPLLSAVTLMCLLNPLPTSSVSLVVSYQWNTAGCYNNLNFNNGNPRCFTNGQTTRDVTGTNLTAEDASTITCTVTISGSDYTSDSFTLRISGDMCIAIHN